MIRPFVLDKVKEYLSNTIPGLMRTIPYGESHNHKMPKFTTDAAEERDVQNYVLNELARNNLPTIYMGFNDTYVIKNINHYIPEDNATDTRELVRKVLGRIASIIKHRADDDVIHLYWDDITDGDGIPMNIRKAIVRGLCRYNIKAWSDQRFTSLFIDANYKDMLSMFETTNNSDGGTTVDVTPRSYLMASKTNT